MEIINNFAPTAKVWVYQATRDITTEEFSKITAQLTEFTTSWNSHGSPVEGGFEIKHNRFIILLATEASGVSGCSIDSSVKVIREIEATYKLGLLDRGTVSYLDQEQVKVIPFTAIKKTIDEGKITPSTLIFNNAVSDLAELERVWLQKAENSWLSRYF